MASKEGAFDEDTDLLYLEQTNWRKVERNLVTDGYREGRSAGEEASLQDNFDAGYVEGVKRVWPISELRGKLCAAIALRHLGTEKPDVESERAGDQVAKLTCLEEQLAAKRGHETTDPAEATEVVRIGVYALKELVKPRTADEPEPGTFSQ